MTQIKKQFRLLEMVQKGTELFQLTQDQEAAVDVLNADAPFVCMKGYSGTGKSTSAVAWRKEHCAGKRVLFTAPTNKAVDVLQKMCDEQGLSDDCMTIHKALGLRMFWERDKQVLRPSRSDSTPLFYSYEIVIIDEASMLGGDLMEYIQDAQAGAMNKVVFMGDPCQLPPVQEWESSSFSVKPQTELRQIMRQGQGSNIVELGAYLRDAVENEWRLTGSDLAQFDGNDVSVVSKDEAFESMLEDFEEAILSGADVRFMAWRNRTVDAVIRKIRERVYGRNCPELMRGEAVRCLKPIFDSIDRSIVHNTDALITIEDIREDVFDGMPIWKIQVAGRWHTVIKAEFESDYKSELKRLLDRAKSGDGYWQDYYNYVETFSWVRPAQGMTVHKSQGSTFDRAYVDAMDILSNRRTREANQCFYVACTRPRKELVVFI